MSFAIVTDDKRMPIVIGAVELLPFEAEAEKESTREIARRSIEKFNAGRVERARLASRQNIARRIAERFSR